MDARHDRKGRRRVSVAIEKELLQWLDESEMWDDLEWYMGGGEEKASRSDKLNGILRAYKDAKVTLNDVIAADQLPVYLTALLAKGAADSGMAVNIVRLQEEMMSERFGGSDIRTFMRDAIEVADRMSKQFATLLGYIDYLSPRHPSSSVETEVE